MNKHRTTALQADHHRRVRQPDGAAGPNGDAQVSHHLRSTSLHSMGQTLPAQRLLRGRKRHRIFSTSPGLKQKTKQKKNNPASSIQHPTSSAIFIRSIQTFASCNHLHSFINHKKKTITLNETRLNDTHEAPMTRLITSNC